jgi:hypothetical protein
MHASKANKYAHAMFVLTQNIILGTLVGQVFKLGKFSGRSTRESLNSPDISAVHVVTAADMDVRPPASNKTISDQDLRS